MRTSIMDESTNNQEEKYLTMTANVLGYLGSLPFIALAATISIANVDAVVIAKSALHLYGAIILSFLGGLHWGRIASKKTIISSDKWILLYSVACKTELNIITYQYSGRRRRAIGY